MATESPRTDFDVIVVGGSYSGLAAAMALGRALRRVLVIDSGRPCNAQTPHSHNFITHDGETPQAIAAQARAQVALYDTVEFCDGLATGGTQTGEGFTLQTDSGMSFSSRKLIFATGIRDVMPDIPGFSDCWGISALHCPYCHGYEVKGEQTGILGNGDFGFEFASLISNLTRDLKLFTNGESTLTSDQSKKLAAHQVQIIESKIERLDHQGGRLRAVVIEDGCSFPLTALYARPPFEQHCGIPEELGCEITEEGYLKVAPSQKTTVPGIFACGDNASNMRTLANAVGTGTTAGMMANKDLCAEEF
jgi:thioredoxin reductase